MNTVLVRYGHSVRTEQYTKKLECKTHRESRDIDENDIVQFSSVQETGVKKMINGNVSLELISLLFASVYGAASRLWFYAYKKYKNGNSARRTYLQRHIRPPITQNGSDNISSGISGKLPKITTSYVIFSRTADRIGAKFCMTIQNIKPNDI